MFLGFIYTVAIWIIATCVTLSWTNERETVRAVNTVEECHINGRTKLAGVIIECKPLAADSEEGGRLMGKLNYWRNGK